jgi:lipoate-protein ligase A
MLVRARALTLEQALNDGRSVTWREAADAVVRGFRESFDITFEPAGLTPEEATRAEAIAAQTYARDQYTFYR